MKSKSRTKETAEELQQRLEESNKYYFHPRYDNLTCDSDDDGLLSKAELRDLKKRSRKHSANQVQCVDCGDWYGKKTIDKWDRNRCGGCFHKRLALAESDMNCGREAHDLPVPSLEEHRACWIEYTQKSIGEDVPFFALCSKCNTSSIDIFTFQSEYTADAQLRPVCTTCCRPHMRRQNDVNRKRLWTNTNGTKTEVLCPLCHDVSLNPFSWIEGHHHARTKDGLYHPSNIFPICVKCNTDMGTVSFKEYARGQKRKLSAEIVCALQEGERFYAKYESVKRRRI